MRGFETQVGLKSARRDRFAEIVVQRYSGSHTHEVHPNSISYSPFPVPRSLKLVQRGRSS